MTASAAGGARRAAALLLPVVALVVAAGLYFRDVLPLPQPTRYFGGDFASYFYPVYRYVAEEVAAGRVPHWTPYVGVGYPLLSDSEAAVFYPPIRLLTGLTGPPGYLGLELYAIGHVVLAGLGGYALARQLAVPAPAAGVTGLTYMFSGFMWAHLSHLSILQAAAWLPWLLAVGARALVTRAVRWTAAGGVVFAILLLSGHPQIASYAGLALLLLAAVALRHAWPGLRWRGRVGMAATALLILLLGTGLAAPQIAPTLALAPATFRWDPGREFLATDTLAPDDLVTFLVPLAYFDTDRFRSVDELSASVAIGALLLAWAALALRRDVWVRYFGLLALVGLVLALAPQLPGLAAVAHAVPVLGLFRAAARATLLTDLGIAGLAGLGLDAWARAVASGHQRPLGVVVWGWRGAVGAALAGEAAVLLGWPPVALGTLSPRFAEFYTYFVVVLVGHVLVLELWRARWLWPGLAAAGTVGLLLVNLMAPHRALAWSPSPPELAWRPSTLVDELRGPPGLQRVWNDGWLHRRGLIFEANAGLLDRLEVVSHYTSLPTARFDEFSRAVEDPWRDAVLFDLMNVRRLVLFEGDTRPRGGGRYTPPRLRPGDERRYELTGGADDAVSRVTVLVEPDAGVTPVSVPSVLATGGVALDVCLGCSPAAGHPSSSATREGRATVASTRVTPRQPARHVRLRNALGYGVTVRELRLDDVDLYADGGRYRQLGPNLWENTAAFPRAFLVEHVLVLPDTGEIVPTLSGMDPRRTAIVETPPECLRRLQRDDPTPPDAAVELVEYAPARVRLHTRHPRPAFLVLTDAHYKEWRAWVDGRRTGIHYVDLLFRGVCVPAGEHDVEFTYRPIAARRGFALAAVSGVAAAAAVALAARRRRPLPSPPEVR